jgi:hypothetical protein
MQVLTDIFLSYASEDRDSVARPLAEELKQRGFRIWYDEFDLKIGDSLTREIDKGLATCRFGVVVLSDYFFAKQWPQRELAGLVSREASQEHKLILPVWHNITASAIRKHSPTLADKIGVPTTKGLAYVADQIEEVVSISAKSLPELIVPAPLIYSFPWFHVPNKFNIERYGKMEKPQRLQYILEVTDVHQGDEDDRWKVSEALAFLSEVAETEKDEEILMEVDRLRAELRIELDAIKEEMELDNPPE